MTVQHGIAEKSTGGAELSAAWGGGGRNAECRMENVERGRETGVARELLTKKHATAPGIRALARAN